MIEYFVIPIDELIHDDDYQTDKIEEAFKKFSCQRETDLENFLRYKAIDYSKNNFGKTFLFIDKTKLELENELTIAGYVTLGYKSMDLTQMSSNKRKKSLGLYPGRDKLTSIPAYLIGQLGRDDKYSSDDLPGKCILDECYCLFAKAAKITGGSLVILECRTHMYEKFYKNMGYKKLKDDVNGDNLYELFTKVDFKEYLD